MRRSLTLRTHIPYQPTEIRKSSPVSNLAKFLHLEDPLLAAGNQHLFDCHACLAGHQSHVHLHIYKSDLQQTYSYAHRTCTMQKSNPANIRASNKRLEVNFVLYSSPRRTKFAECIHLSYAHPPIGINSPRTHP